MRRSRIALAASLTATSSLVLVALVAEGAPPATSRAVPPPPTLARDAGADASDASSAARARIPPDPPALVASRQWLYVLRWERGEIYLADVQETDLGEPRPTPRVMGRFALELYEGKTLVERARFDFPMLGSPEDAGTGFFAAPRFEPKLTTRIGVLFPVTSRGTRLDLWDRATGERWSLPWPPVPGPGGGMTTADAGR